MDNKELARFIDHTLLKPQAGKEEIKKLCREAKEQNFAAVCVLPYYVALGRELLAESEVLVATVIGFPLGANSSEAKAAEVKAALKQGADELDLVINFAALLDGDEDTVKTDLERVIAVAGGKTVKAIIETCFLDKEQKIKAALLAREAGADYVKTSTGFGSGGAQKEDVLLLREVLQGGARIKASGGIRDRPTALTMIEAGADRFRLSHGLFQVDPPGRASDAGVQASRSRRGQQDLDRPESGQSDGNLAAGSHHHQ